MTLTVRRLVLAAVGLAATAAVAPAGWNNVGQVMCCDGPIRRAFRAPEPVRSSYYETRHADTRSSLYETRYEETSRYETVRVMKPVTVQEPVDVKVRSYYYEPVTSYTRRSFYDPCSGECQSVEVPRTSYVRRDEVRTETRYLERMQMVPVEMVREVKEETPVYTYRGPTVRKYGPLVPATSSGSAPRIEREQGDTSYQNIPGQKLPTTSGSGYGLQREVPKQMPEKAIPKSESRIDPRDAAYKFNALSTARAKATGATVFGEVTASDRRTPLSNAKLVFVNAANLDDRRYVAADSFGGFDATLPAGEWIVYAGPGSGKADRISTFAVKDGDKQQLGVTTR